MSNSYTPAGKLIGRRIRLMYVAVLVLLFLARMWSEHGEMAGVAGRLPGQSTEVAHAVFVRVYAPQTAADLVERSIADWRAQHAAVAQLLARVCAGGDALCVHFHTLDEQML